MSGKATAPREDALDCTVAMAFPATGIPARSTAYLGSLLALRRILRVVPSPSTVFVAVWEHLRSLSSRGDVRETSCWRNQHEDRHVVLLPTTGQYISKCELRHYNGLDASWCAIMATYGMKHYVLHHHGRRTTRLSGWVDP